MSCARLLLERVEVCLLKEYRPDFLVWPGYSPLAVTASVCFLGTAQGLGAMWAALYREHSPLWSGRIECFHVVLTSTPYY